MSPNKVVITKYFESSSALDRQAVVSYLTENVERVEWADGFPDSGVPLRGKAAFEKNLNDPPGGGRLGIEVTRMTEENNVVVAECIVRVPKKEGGFTVIKALDVFELENGKVKRMDSFTAVIKDSS